MLKLTDTGCGTITTVTRSGDMAGTKMGGIKAAATNKQRYGLSFYEQIGSKGGKISRGGGFAVNRELAVEAGRKGGKARRSKPDAE
jgi:general stress protein YciG